MIVGVAGVSGSGKTTVGRALAAALGWTFHDADDHHDPANIAKMARGQPLTDADREPWLTRLANLLAEEDRAGRNAVLACSALKKAHRDQLRAAARDVRFIQLRADRELLQKRMEERKGHFMPAALLDSQLAAEEALGEEEGVVVDAAAGLDEATRAVRSWVGL